MNDPATAAADERRVIIMKALREYYDSKVKNLPREDLDLYAAQNLIDEHKDVIDWFDKLYSDYENEK